MGVIEKNRRQRSATKNCGRVHLDRWPEIGARVEIGRHAFEFVGHVAHTRRDGVMTELGRWIGTCAECGRNFETASPQFVLPETRRCEFHRRPGVRAR